MNTQAKQKQASKSEVGHVPAAAVESLDGSYSANTCECWHLIYTSARRTHLGYLLPPSRNPNLTMRIQRHAVRAWLLVHYIAADPASVTGGARFFGPSWWHFANKIFRELRNRVQKGDLDVGVEGILHQSATSVIWC